MLPYVLVAEKSLLPIIGLVVASIEKNANPGSITIIVPDGQVDSFGSVVGYEHKVLGESAVLPQWPLSRVREYLSKHENRAGWYLQQFLKLAFGAVSGHDRYVIWDADTVMLKRPVYFDGGKVMMNVSSEYHPDYFITYKRLFNRPATLPKSVISQYMAVDQAVVVAMQDEIERLHGREWIEAILTLLPGKSPSEFSEYETYANYLNTFDPGRISLSHTKWFRYGAEVLPRLENVALKDIEVKFNHYDYIAFERHPSSFLKKVCSNLLLTFRVSS